MDGALLNSHTEPLELVRVDVNPPSPRLKAGGQESEKSRGERSTLTCLLRPLLKWITISIISVPKLIF